MKVNVPDSHCKGCLWLIKDNVCPFARCVRWFGFKTDKKVNS